MSRKPAAARALRPSDTRITVLALACWTPRPASQKPTTMPIPNIATSAPMSAGPAPVSSEIAGTIGPMIP